MSLQKFLQQERNDHSAAMLESGSSSVTEKDFEGASQDFFNDVAEPFIINAIEAFNANGYAAQRGQLLEAGGYAYAENAVSLSVVYKNIEAQWDIYSNVLMNKVTIRFFYNNKENANSGKSSIVDRHFEADATTTSLLEQIVEDDLSRVAFGIPTDSQSIAKEGAGRE